MERTPPQISFEDQQFPDCCGIALLFNAQVIRDWSLEMRPKATAKDYLQAFDEYLLNEQQEYTPGAVDEDGPPGMVMYACTQEQVELAKALQKLSFVSLPGFINPRSGNTITVYYKIINQPPPPREPKPRKPAKKRAKR